jgi:hypothetical protein
MVSDYRQHAGLTQRVKQGMHERRWAPLRWRPKEVASGVYSERDSVRVRRRNVRRSNVQRSNHMSGCRSTANHAGGCRLHPRVQAVSAGQTHDRACWRWRRVSGASSGAGRRSTMIGCRVRHVPFVGCTSSGVFTS